MTAVALGRRRQRRFAPAAAIASLPTRVLVSLIFLGIAASMLFPLYITIITSFKTLSDYQGNSLGLPKTWTWHNFAAAWTQGNMGEYARNSAVVTGIGLVMLVVVVLPAGYAFAKLEFPGRRVLLAAIISIVVISPNLQVVPIFKMAADYHLVDNQAGLSLVYVSFSLPFGIYLMSSYFEGVPSTIFDAARVDGAGALTTFLRIAVPIARPGLLTLLTFSFLGFWNEYLFGLIILLDPNKRTLPVGVASLQSESYTSQPLLSAGLVITMIPCVLIFLLLQRNLNEGLTAGAVK